MDLDRAIINWNPDNGESASGVYLIFEVAPGQRIAVLRCESSYLILPKEAATLLQLVPWTEGSALKITRTGDGFDITETLVPPQEKEDATALQSINKDKK